jgi:hypothetical protein
VTCAFDWHSAYTFGVAIEDWNVSAVTIDG